MRADAQAAAKPDNGVVRLPAPATQQDGGTAARGEPEAVCHPASGAAAGRACAPVHDPSRGAVSRAAVELPRLKATGEEWELPCSPLRRGYFETSLCCCDLDGDGEQEILITGNPGVVIWLDHEDGAWCERVPLRGSAGRRASRRWRCPAWRTWTAAVRPTWWWATRPATCGGSPTGPPRRGRSTSPPECACTRAAARSTTWPARPGSIQGPNEARWGYLNPLVPDWDGDGLFDVITNDIHGRYLWYRNTGSRQEPRFAAAEPLRCAGEPLTGAWPSRPAAWGEDCLLLLNRDGFLQLYRRAGRDPAHLEAGPLVRYRDGNLVRGCGPGGLWGRSVFCACDWDLDGTRDLVAGTSPAAPPRSGCATPAPATSRCSSAPASSPKPTAPRSTWDTTSARCGATTWTATAPPT